MTTFDLTTDQVVWKLAALRSSGFNAKQHAEWCRILEDWPPETVLEAGTKLAAGWMEIGDWRIGHLVSKLPKIAKPQSERKFEPFHGFCWDTATGKTRGDWKAFDRLEDAERLSIAVHLLGSVREDLRIQHVETARRMHPEAVEEFERLQLFEKPEPTEATA